MPDNEAPGGPPVQFKKLWSDEIEQADIAGLGAQELEALIHTLTARRLVEALRDPEQGRSYGILTAARGFLRDNEITGLTIPGSAQEALRKELSSRAPFKLTGTDT